MWLYKLHIRVWHSLVVRLVRDQEVVGSNPVTPTKTKERAWATYCKAGRPTKFALSGKWNRFAVKYLLRKCEMFASRTRANFISRRTKWDISQCALAHYFTFCLAKHFTYIYRPKIRFYKRNTLYLAGQGMWKGVRTNRPYSFCCRAGVYLPPFSLHISFVFGGSKPPPYKVAAGKTCFMEDTRYEVLFFLARVDKKDAYYFFENNDLILLKKLFL